MPPLVQIGLIVLALWKMRRYPKLAWLGIGLALLSLWLLATPLGAVWLSVGLENTPVLRLADKSRWQQAQAIVVLGGGREFSSEFGQEMPNYWTASRLRYGAYLYRHTGLPLAVTGGRKWASEKEPEAVIMARSLRQDYVVNVRWQEEQSASTWENAQFSYAKLAPEGIRHIIVVTQAMHMPRARVAFEKAGFTVIAAPIDFTTANAPLLLQLLPSASAWGRSVQAWHEYGGLLVYTLRAWVDG